MPTVRSYNPYTGQRGYKGRVTSPARGSTYQKPVSYTGRNPADVKAGIDASKTTYDPRTGRESSVTIKGQTYDVKYKDGKQVIGQKTSLAQVKQKTETVRKQMEVERQAELKKQQETRQKEIEARSPTTQTKQIPKPTRVDSLLVDRSNILSVAVAEQKKAQYERGMSRIKPPKVTVAKTKVQTMEEALAFGKETLYTPKGMKRVEKEITVDVPIQRTAQEEPYVIEKVKVAPLKTVSVKKYYATAVKKDTGEKFELIEGEKYKAGEKKAISKKVMQVQFVPIEQPKQELVIEEFKEPTLSYKVKGFITKVVSRDRYQYPEELKLYAEKRVQTFYRPIKEVGKDIIAINPMTGLDYKKIEYETIPEVVRGLSKVQSLSLETRQEGIKQIGKAFLEVGKRRPEKVEEAVYDLGQKYEAGWETALEFAKEGQKAYFEKTPKKAQKTISQSLSLLSFGLSPSYLKKKAVGTKEYLEQKGFTTVAKAVPTDLPTLAVKGTKLGVETVATMKGLQMAGPSISKAIDVSFAGYGGYAVVKGKGVEEKTFGALMTIPFGLNVASRIAQETSYLTVIEKAKKVPTPSVEIPGTQLRKRASMVLRDEKGKILYLKDKRSGKYILPGGDIKPGETPLMAGLRELKEETGLQSIKLKQIDVIATTREKHFVLEGTVKGIKELKLQEKEVTKYKFIKPKKYTGPSARKYLGEKGTKLSFLEKTEVRADDLYIGSRSKYIKDINKQLESIGDIKKSPILKEAKEFGRKTFGEAGKLRGTKSYKYLTEKQLVQEYLLSKKGLTQTKLVINPAEIFMAGGKPRYVTRVEPFKVTKPSTYLDKLRGKKPGQFKKFQETPQINIGFGSKYDIDLPEEYFGKELFFVRGSPTKVQKDIITKEFYVDPKFLKRGEKVMFFQPPSAGRSGISEGYLGADYLKIGNKDVAYDLGVTFGKKPTIQITKSKVAKITDPFEIKEDRLVFTKKAIRSQEFEAGAEPYTSFKLTGKKTTGLGGRRVSIEKIEIVKAQKGELTVSQIEKSLKGLSKQTEKGQIKTIKSLKQKTKIDYSSYIGKRPATISEYVSTIKKVPKLKLKPSTYQPSKVKTGAKYYYPKTKEKAVKPKYGELTKRYKEPTKPVYSAKYSKPYKEKVIKPKYRESPKRYKEPTKPYKATEYAQEYEKAGYQQSYYSATRTSRQVEKKIPKIDIKLDKFQKDKPRKKKKTKRKYKYTHVVFAIGKKQFKKLKSPSFSGFEIRGQ